MSADPGPRGRSPDGARRRWISLALLVAYATALFVGIGLDPIRDLERAGGGAATGWDKALHLIAFLVLGLLCAAVTLTFLEARLLRVTGLALLIGGTYASVHEGSQAWLPGFAFNPADLVANLLGVLLGVLFAVVLRGVVRGSR